jgi:hypothetical protein
VSAGPPSATYRVRKWGVCDLVPKRAGTGVVGVVAHSSEAFTFAGSILSENAIGQDRVVHSLSRTARDIIEEPARMEHAAVGSAPILTGMVRVDRASPDDAGAFAPCSATALFAARMAGVHGVATHHGEAVEDAAAAHIGTANRSVAESPTGRRCPTMVVTSRPLRLRTSTPWTSAMRFCIAP